MRFVPVKFDPLDLSISQTDHIHAGIHLYKLSNPLARVSLPCAPFMLCTVAPQQLTLAARLLSSGR
jgi:hypothetical protein